MLKDRRIRAVLLIFFTPGVFWLIAMMVIMRPLTAYADGFHGPDDMWRDVIRWARTGEMRFPSWQRATRDHLPRHHRAS